MIFLNEYLYCQLAAHIILTLLYVSMFLVIKPYSDPASNKREIFNEMCVLAVSYSLISMNDTSVSFEMREYIGTSYVGICCFNLVLNLGNIVKSLVFKSIPSAYKKSQQNKREVEYQKTFMEYLDSKIEFCKANPDITLGKEIKRISEVNKFLNQRK